MTPAEQQIALLSEIRDLLQIIAEPQLADRDRKARQRIREVAGRSGKKQAAVLLMDGTRSRSEISQQSELDSGNLSRFIAELREAGVLAEPDGKAKTVCPLPPTLFEQEDEQ